MLTCVHPYFLLAGKIRMMLEILPIGAASPARGRYLATLVRLQIG